jgi:hypothetical protein
MRIHGRPVRRDDSVYPSPLEFESIRAYQREVPQTVQFGDNLRRIMLARKFREASDVTHDKKTLDLVNVADAERSYESFQRALDEDELFDPKKLREHFSDYPSLSTEEERILHRSRMNRNIDRAHGYIADNMEQSQEAKYRVLQKREEQKTAILTSGLVIREHYPKPEEQDDKDHLPMQITGPKEDRTFLLDLKKMGSLYADPTLDDYVFNSDSDDDDDEPHISWNFTQKEFDAQMNESLNSSGPIKNLRTEDDFINLFQEALNEEQVRMYDSEDEGEKGFYGKYFEKEDESTGWRMPDDARAGFDSDFEYLGIDREDLTHPDILT